MILITGGTGLVGSHIVRRLVDQGQSIRCLRRNESDLSLLGDYASRVAWVVGDVTDVVSLDEAMQGIHQVYHCAALIAMRSHDLDRMMHVNTEGTANVVNAALHAGVSRMLYVSSVGAFGRPTPEGILIDEQIEVKDSTDNYDYFKSKLYAEREVWRGIAEGLESVIINPSTILGGGQWSHPPNSLFAQVANGIPFYATGGNAFVDVRDVAEVAILLMNSLISAEKFIVSAANLSFKALQEMVADALGVKRPSFTLSPPLAAIAWQWEAIKSRLSGTAPLLTAQSADMAMRTFRYNNDKIVTALPFTFRPIEQTVREVAALYLESVKLGKSYNVLE